MIKLSLRGSVAGTIGTDQTGIADGAPPGANTVVLCVFQQVATHILPLFLIKTLQGNFPDRLVLHRRFWCSCGHRLNRPGRG